MLSLDTSEKIDGFVQSLKDCKSELNSGLTLHNARFAVLASKKTDIHGMHDGTSVYEFA